MKHPTVTTIPQKFLLGFSILLIFVGLLLTFGGVFSPAWQVVEIREFRGEHQHGLWWDCVRGVKHVVAVGDFYDEEQLHCMYKVDSSADIVIENALNTVDTDGAVGEAEYHKFWGWHKIVLFFAISSFFIAFIAIMAGALVPFLRPVALLFLASIMIAALFSVIADGIAFFSMKRVDTRFVQGMVGVYEQRIGYAFYLHLGGSLLWMLSCVFSLLTVVRIYASPPPRSDSHVHLFDPQSTNPREQRAVVTVQKPTPPRIQATTTTTAAENGFVGRQQQWFPRPGQASGNGGGSPTSSTLGLVPLADARGMLGTQTQV